MRRIAVPRQQQDNQNNKRWSTSLIENSNHREEQVFTPFQSPYSKLLTNKLGIPKEKAFVTNFFLSSSMYMDFLRIENILVIEHV